MKEFVHLMNAFEWTLLSIVTPGTLGEPKLLADVPAMDRFSLKTALNLQSPSTRRSQKSFFSTVRDTEHRDADQDPAQKHGYNEPKCSFPFMKVER